MFCRYCGNRVRDGLTICSHCGADLSGIQPGPGLVPPPKKTKWALWISLAICMAAAVCAGLFFLIQSLSGNDKEVIALKIEEDSAENEKGAQQKKEKQTKKEPEEEGAKEEPKEERTQKEEEDPVPEEKELEQMNDYTVTVRQHDLSDFPTIKLYLDVTDPNDNFVEGLMAESFLLNTGTTVNGSMSRQKIVRAGELDGEAGISVGLIADISGSMEDNLEAAENAMRSFIEGLQYAQGDEVELTSFADKEYICQYFTNDVNALNQSINSMTANGGTRLYDTIISELQRVYSRNNAKCVIAFTDGEDNVSNSTEQEVIDCANSLKIPVFLIGVGDFCDEATLKNIAASTGGSYYNIEDAGALEGIYDEIYVQEKASYLLEYTVDNTLDREHMVSDIYVRAQSPDGTYRGGCTKGYDIDVMDFFESMYNKFIIASMDCQTRGERNLLDSGLIVTTEEAYNEPECVAYQSQQSINEGGVGSNHASVFMVLLDSELLNVQKDGDQYVLYGFGNYDISKIRSYGKLADKEKAAITENCSEEQQVWLEENRTLYEKLTLVKDADGRWKFRTRVYEREDGGDSVVINEIYQYQFQ